MDKIYIVMNYVEHDLKSLMETMKQPFLPGSVRYFELLSLSVKSWVVGKMLSLLECNL